MGMCMMANEPTAAEIEEIELAYNSTATPMILAPGPLPQGRRGEVGGALWGILYWGEMAGLRRIVFLHDDGPVIELTRDRIASTRIKTQFLSADMSVEVTAKREGSDDGSREQVILAGSKKALKKAFHAIGYPL